MEYERTYRIDRIYHHFLKRRKIPLNNLPDAIAMLEEHQFIETFPADQGIRYRETPKLTSGDHFPELNKLFKTLKRELRQ